ncbi:hypothetical protein EWM64_g6083 [Hericium alpestre]|uniref:Major facilitator superfamily (MFS) profile domain-containing protein n=1 Tax=Hericium alpestre TaxID=135208 RepID=A0A4Y9ZT01_9AGAM|nr:hypothetical protein EWM64_g6083 [Hericium alpestre]
MTFADKTTLGQSAVLGIKQGANINQNQFNWLGTIFYLSYLAFQYPQNLALQRLPIGKWISINVLVWAIALLCHGACHSFGALFAVRFIMGICEGAITLGFLLVTSMFYTRAEQMRRVGYWYLMNGVAVIVLGFLAFGVLHIHTGGFMLWQWLTTITGIMTLIVAVLFWFLFPDSVVTARILSPEERVAAVQRIRINQTGVENKTWVFAVFAAVTNLINSLTNQRQLIVNEFGFSVINTTLIGCVDGLVEIAAIFISVTLAAVWPNGRIYAAVLCFLPALVGTFLVSTLAFYIKGGLLVSYWLSIFGIPPFAIFLSWMDMVTAGHTKRECYTALLLCKIYYLTSNGPKGITTNAIVFTAYGLGNAVGPFMWKAQYSPRNHVPWDIFSGVCVVSVLLLLLARWMLARENARRDREAEQNGSTKSDAYDDVYIEGLDAEGWKVKTHVDRAFLDLTDIQNREFRYPL